jgi:hypothetical protein
MTNRIWFFVVLMVRDFPLHIFLKEVCCALEGIRHHYYNQKGYNYENVIKK